MAIRDRMRASAAQFLQPGETIQEVFAGQTAPVWVQALPLGALGGIILVVFNRYRIFAVTDQRILVLDAGKWTMTKAHGVVTELPRGTQLGEGSRVWHVIQAGQEKIRVHRRFFKDLRAADAAIAPVAG